MAIAREVGGSGKEELKKYPSLPLRSCDSWLLVKENPDRKKTRLGGWVFAYEQSGCWFEPVLVR